MPASRTLGGELRPPSEPPPRIRLRGQARARSGTFERQAVGQGGHAFFSPTVPSPSVSGSFFGLGQSLTEYSLPRRRFRGIFGPIIVHAASTLGRSSAQRLSLGTFFAPLMGVGLEGGWDEEEAGSEPKAVVPARHQDKQCAGPRGQRLQAAQPASGGCLASSLGAPEQAAEGLALSVRHVHAQLLHQPRRQGPERLAEAGARARQGRAAGRFPSRAAGPPDQIEEIAMPEKKTLERAQEDLREGKGASTAAGEFVREEMHHIREGKHGARSTKQAIAIGL